MVGVFMRCHKREDSSFFQLLSGWFRRIHRPDQLHSSPVPFDGGWTHTSSWASHETGLGALPAKSDLPRFLLEGSRLDAAGKAVPNGSNCIRSDPD